MSDTGPFRCLPQGVFAEPDGDFAVVTAVLQSRHILFLEHARTCRDRARAIPGMMHLYLEMAQDWENLASLARELARDAAERDAFFERSQ